jgi:hypothetical protein
MVGVLMIARAGALAVVWVVADRTFESAHVRDRIDQTRCLFERTGRLSTSTRKGDCTVEKFTLLGFAMRDGLRLKRMLCGMILMLSWSLMPVVLPIAFPQPVPPQPVPIEPIPVQPVPPQPVPGQPSPAMTPAEAERAREAEQLKQAEGARAAEPETRIERKQLRPSETYVAGFAGYTFGG